MSEDYEDIVFESAESIYESSPEAEHARRISELEAERDEARKVVSDTLWMAGRYADGRMTYAVSLYNDARRIAEAGGYAGGAQPALDGMDVDKPATA